MTREDDERADARAERDALIRRRAQELREANERRAQELLERRQREAEAARTAERTRREHEEALRAARELAAREGRDPRWDR